jgi:hypothetical protein
MRRLFSALVAEKSDYHVSSFFIIMQSMGKYSNAHVQKSRCFNE